jgi:3',5'-cyclic AMP phosphodiesterase CpdA
MPDAPLAFGLLTDTHYAPAAYGNRDCPGALARLQTTLDAFAAAGVRLVVNLGDAVDDARSVPAELALCVEIRAAFAGFPGSVLHAIGNHDVAMLSKQEFLAAIGSAYPPYYSLDYVGVHLIVLDGNNHEDGSDFCRGDFSWDEAWITEAQLRWLEQDLDAAAHRPTLIFCHECLDESTDDPHVVRNASDVRQLLRGHSNIRGIFQGHYHPGRRRTLHGIPSLTLPALATGVGNEPVGAIVTLETTGALTVRML